jgi:hypothetical protein
MNEDALESLVFPGLFYFHNPMAKLSLFIIAITSLAVLLPHLSKAIRKS